MFLQSTQEGQRQLAWGIDTNMTAPLSGTWSPPGTIYLTSGLGQRGSQRLVILSVPEGNPVGVRRARHPHKQDVTIVAWRDDVEYAFRPECEGRGGKDLDEGERGGRIRQLNI